VAAQSLVDDTFVKKAMKDMNIYGSFDYGARES
jgi:hypothetical protein